LQRLQLLNTPEQAARAESARRQLADEAFGDSNRLTRVVAEFRRAGANADLLAVLDRAAAQCPEALTPELRLTHAELLADREDWSAVTATLAGLSETDRRGSPALLLNTRAALAGNQPAAAAELLRQVPIAEQPEALRERLVAALVEADMFEKAAAFIPNSPTHPDALFVKAVNLAAAGQLHDAIDALQIPVSLSPPRVAALWTFAQCHAALENRSEARDALTKLLLQRPGHAQARLLRARLAIEQQDFEAAAADLTLMLRQEPDQGEALLMQGAIRLNTGRPLDALRDLTRLLRKEPKNADALYLRGRTLQNLDRSTEAIADLNLALDIRPAFPEALLLLATITAAEGRPGESLQLLDRVIVLQPGSFKAWYDRGILLYRSGQFDQAAASWNRALECKPGDVRTRISRAAALRKLQDDAGALEEYRAVLRLEPENASATLLAASLLISTTNSELRNPDAAEKLARIACEKSGFNDPQSLRVLAQACTANQRSEEADRWVARAQRLSLAASSPEGIRNRTAARPAPTQTLSREARVEGSTSRN
jgi:tetratricopeptide (TPR) repeat protein